MKHFFTLILILLGFTSTIFLEDAKAQCTIKDPKDGTATTNPNPVYNCLNEGQNPAYTLKVEFTNVVNGVTIDWGDGSAPQTFSGTTVNHTYAAAGTYVYTISGCGEKPIEGLLVSGVDDGSVPGFGFSGPPAGPSNLYCLPATLEFELKSSSMDGFDRFRIEWGDGTDTIVDIRAKNKPIWHTYTEELERCLVDVRVTYQSACRNIQEPRGITLENIYFITKENARAEVDTVVICGPMDVTIKEDSKLNECVQNVPRKIMWKSVRGLDPLPDDGVYKDYTEQNRRITIPARYFDQVPADSMYVIRLALRTDTCAHDSIDIPIIMVQPVQPQFTVAADTVCPGATIVFKNRTTKPSNYPEWQIYEWNWGDGSGPQIDSGFADTVSHVFAVGGTYTVTLNSIVNTSDGQSCKKTFTKTIVVREALSPLIAVSPKVFCDSAIVTLKNKSINTEGVSWLGWKLGANINYTGTPDYLPKEGTYMSTSSADSRRAIVYDLNAADSTVKIKYPTWGKYIIELHAQTGSGQSGRCNDPVAGYDTVNIYPSPTLRWRLSRETVCLGQALQSRDSTTILGSGDNRGLPQNIRNLTWKLDFGDGPNSVFTSEKEVTGNWDRADITNRIKEYVYTRTGTYTITLTVSTPYCTTTESRTVEVREAAQPAFEYVQNECDASTIRFINKTQPVPNTYYMWIIYRNGMEVDTIVRQDTQPFDTTFSYISGASTDYEVMLMSITGDDYYSACRIRTPRQWVQIPPVTQALFDFAGTSVPGCAPMKGLRFVDRSFYVPEGSTYTWDFGNGTTFTGSREEAPPVPVYDNNTDSIVTYKAKLTIRYPEADTCSFSYTREIMVYPKANLNVVFPDTICSEQAVVFAAQGNGLRASSLVWKFSDMTNNFEGNATVQRTFINNSADPVRYTVTLTGGNNFNCSDSITKEFVVRPAPKPSFTWSDSIGCSPLVVTFTNTSDTSSSAFSGAMTYVWNYGDGSRPDTVYTKVPRTHTFVNNGGAEVNYTVTLTMISPNGCSTSVKKSLVVKPELIASIRFANEADSAGCSPHKVTIMNLSSQRQGLEYLWTFSDPDNADISGKHSLSGPVTFRNDADVPVTYTVKFRVSSNDCSKEDSLKVTVWPLPKPDFEFISPNPMQLPENTVRLRNTSPAMEAWNYVWYFGNGDSLVSNQREVTYTYQELEEEYRDSIYTITLKAVGAGPYSCAQSTSKQLKIKPTRPIADFEVITQPACVPNEVKFRNLSKYGHSNGYFWNFGDGNTSRLANPTHTYTIGGEFDVTLTVRGVGGEDQVIKEKIVVAYDVPAVTIQTVPGSNRTLRIPSEQLNCFAIINFENPNESYVFNWDFGDGGWSTERNPVHKYTEAGTYVVTLKTSSASGCYSIVQDTIRVEFEEGKPVLIPTAFSPNLEGPNRTRIDPSQPAPGNDIFYPVAVGASNIHLQVFNRWGQIIFESKELGYGWDGYHNGKLCQQDVYIYKLLVIFPDGRRTRKMGDVTLVR